MNTREDLLKKIISKEYLLLSEDFPDCLPSDEYRDRLIQDINNLKSKLSNDHNCLIEELKEINQVINGAESINIFYGIVRLGPSVFIKFSDNRSNKYFEPIRRYLRNNGFNEFDKTIYYASDIDLDIEVAFPINFKKSDLLQEELSELLSERIEIEVITYDLVYRVSSDILRYFFESYILDKLGLFRVTSGYLGTMEPIDVNQIEEKLNFYGINYDLQKF